jgi:hypothetical protein
MAADLERANTQPRAPAVAPPGRPASAAAGMPCGNDAVERWEIHSELVLVSPEVRRGALEVLARERTMHLLRYRPVDRGNVSASAPVPFLVALGLYLARAVALTLVLACITAGGAFAVALAVELARR